MVLESDQSAIGPDRPRAVSDAIVVNSVSNPRPPNFFAAVAVKCIHNNDLISTYSEVQP